ncbi:transposase domain-containing protein [Escherichia coli]
MFAGSDSGGEHAAVLYSLIGTCRLNNVEPEKWLRYVIEHIQDWPANRVRNILPWKVDSELSVNINTVLTSRLPMQ